MHKYHLIRIIIISIQYVVNPDSSEKNYINEAELYCNEYHKEMHNKVFSVTLAHKS